MNQTPTVEQFLAQQSTEDDIELEHPETTDPLESIADSLRRIAAGVGGEPLPAEVVTGADEEAAWRAEYDDLYEKYNALFGLLADVEKIVKPSTSKVSLEVKAAIDMWKSPVVTEVEAEPEACLGDDGLELPEAFRIKELEP